MAEDGVPLVLRKVFGGADAEGVVGPDLVEDRVHLRDVHPVADGVAGFVDAEVELADDGLEVRGVRASLGRDEGVVVQELDPLEDHVPAHADLDEGRVRNGRGTGWNLKNFIQKEIEVCLADLVLEMLVTRVHSC